MNSDTKDDHVKKDESQVDVNDDSAQDDTSDNSSRANDSSVQNGMAEDRAGGSTESSLGNSKQDSCENIQKDRDEKDDCAHDNASGNSSSEHDSTVQKSMAEDIEGGSAESSLGNSKPGSCENIQKDRDEKDDSAHENASHNSSSEHESSVQKSMAEDGAGGSTESSSGNSEEENFETILEVSDENETATNQQLPCNSCASLEPVTSIKIPRLFGLITQRKGLKYITEFWVISVPKMDDTWEILNERTGKYLSQNFKFHIPELKVGTMDILVGLMDQLKSQNNFVQDITRKLANYMKEALQGNKESLEKNLVVNDLSPQEYLTRFSWNRAKYPTWNPTPLIADTIFRHVDNISKTFQKNMCALDKIRFSLKKYEGRETESLATRYLGDIVNNEHFVLNSSFLVTLVVVVPNSKIKLWLKSYESLCDMVVPQSSEKIFDDGTQSLFTVTLSRKHVDVFQTKARENAFIVRNFEYSEVHVKSQKAHYEHMAKVKMNMIVNMFRWVKINFGECFEAWIHTVALRVFVDSAMRFGLPVNFRAMLVVPLSSKKKLKKLLKNLYKSAPDRFIGKVNLDDIPVELRMYDVEDYYPYVFFKIDLNFLS